MIRVAPSTLLMLCLTVQIPAQSAGASHSTRRSAVSRDDQPAIDSAVADYENGQAAKAAPVLQRLAKRYPGDSKLQAAAGMAAMESGDLPGGLPYLERASALNPRNITLMENLGIALLRLDRPGDALKLLRKARQRQTGSSTAYVGEAQALLALKQYDEAAVAFQAAVPLAASPRQADDLRHDWSIALLEANKAQQALAVLQATADGDANASTQELLGEAEEKLGHYTQAFAHFKRAAELDPDEQNLLAYGNELLQHWTFTPAIEIFTYAHERFPQNDRLYTGLGVAYFGSNDFTHAAEVFRAQLAAHPEDANTADLLGRSCSATVSNASCTELVSFARRHPSNATASLYAAIALLHQADAKDMEMAEVLLKQSLAADPQSPVVWYELAVLQQQRGQWGESSASLERAVALRPQYAEAHYRLARAYNHEGRKVEAQQQIAIQQEAVQSAKDIDTKRMQEVMTFLTANR